MTETKRGMNGGEDTAMARRMGWRARENISPHLIIIAPLPYPVLLSSEMNHSTATYV